MIKVIKFIVFMGAFLLWLSGCATINSSYAPTEEELANADYGEKPTQYKEQIETYVKAILIDPESVQFTDYSTPKKDWLSKFSGLGSIKYYGWLVCVDVNAKNRYGGYAGRKTYYFIFQGNNITHAKTDGYPDRDVAYGAWKHQIICR